VAYESNMTLSDLAHDLYEVDGPIVVLTHAKPDGDALGSALALSLGLERLGKTVITRFVGPVPDMLQTLPGFDPSMVESPSQGDVMLPDSDAIVIVDTGAYGQVGAFANAVKERLNNVFVIDHHLSGDIHPPRRVVDSSAAACAQVIAQLLDRLPADHDLVHDQDIATLLFAGIASDTGWFRFSNTSPATHELAARLIRAGVDHSEIYAELEQAERPEKLKLLVRAVRSLELLCEDRVAIMTLRKQDFAETGALEIETERFVDVPQQVQSVQVVAMVTESTMNHNGEGPLTRVSFRSKPGQNAVNVAELANTLGGGGHARASGAKLAMSVDEALPRLREVLQLALPCSG